MIYAHRQKNRRGLQRRQHEQGGGETDALSGLAGAGRLQLAQVQPGHLSAELLLPRLQHLDAPFVILYAMYTMNKQSDAAQYHVHTAYMHSPHTGCVCVWGVVCVCGGVSILVIRVKGTLSVELLLCM